MATRKPANKPPRATDPLDVPAAIAQLRALGEPRVREQMGTQFGIHVDHAFGVPVPAIRALANAIGRDHTLAQALWREECYEARMLAVFVDDPAAVTPAQMDRWCRTFDNWALCDTACFHLFDKTPHAWAKIEQWAMREPEFEKRAAFALLASVALHDKKAPDAPFRRGLELVAAAAGDGRNFVKKAVNWALRGIGKRNATLGREALALAERLAAATEPAARWCGKDAARELEKRLRRR